MFTSTDQIRDRERRREAVRLARKGIGRRLEIMLEETVREPAPRSWLALLEKADQRARQEQDRPRRAG
jgi:hypothetical protein